MATAWEVAYQALRRRLADGTYPPGAHLREEDLAQQLGVSRTPIREALRRLDAEGWVRGVPNQGVFAAEWSNSDIEEIFGLRALLEPHAAERAANAASSRLLEVMEEACGRAESALPGGGMAAIEVISDCNVSFHRALWEMSGQTRCRSILQSLAVPPMMLRNFREFDVAGLRRSIAQHREMVSAIAAGDGSWAAAVMRAHVEAGRAAFVAANARGRAGRRAA